jgi:uncharacterized membrane protein
MSGESQALRYGIAALIALLALEILWHGWIAPPRSALFWPSLALAAAPLLPALWSAHASLRRGVLIGGIVCLFYFAHGVTTLWNGDAPRWLAATEMLLALIVIGALGWDARKYKRVKKSLSP